VEHRPRRRQFLALAAGAGGLAALAGFGLRPGLKRMDRSARALGSKVSLTVFHEDPAVAERALSASFAALDAVEDALSLYRPGSDLARLNRDGALENPHPDLVSVLRSALDWSRRTDGAFDPTVQPLWALHSRGTPAAADVEAARALVDWTKVDVGPRRIAFGRPGMAATLNGIAQGFAADRVRETLLAHGVRHALADTGEFNGIGRKPDGEAWRVGIQHPRNPEAWAALAELQDRFLATSGDYATPFSPDFKSHHIFDPSTGRSPGELASVTILAPTGMEADALSTAVFVLGPDRGLALAASRPGVDALLVLKDGTQVRTPTFPRVA
jgi:thiamine biosynthesis lipoprotein